MATVVDVQSIQWSTSMKYKEILQNATDIIQDRGLNDYGHPADNMLHAAAYLALMGQLATEETDDYV